MVAIVMLLLHNMQIELIGFRTTAEMIGLNLLLISLIFSLLSAFDYTVAVLFHSPSDSTVAGSLAPQRAPLEEQGKGRSLLR